MEINCIVNRFLSPHIRIHSKPHDSELFANQMQTVNTEIEIINCALFFFYCGATDDFQLWSFLPLLSFTIDCCLWTIQLNVCISAISRHWSVFAFCGWVKQRIFCFFFVKQLINGYHYIIVWEKFFNIFPHSMTRIHEIHWLASNFIWRILCDVF